MAIRPQVAASPIPARFDAHVPASTRVTMASSDILRYIDTIARDKEIDPEQLIAGIETAVVQALSRKYGIDDLVMSLDRKSGEWITNYEIDLEAEGRIVAQAVKQSIIGRVREAERDVLYDEFEQKIGEIYTGTVQRFEGDTVIVNLGRNMEGIIPRAEKVRGENYNVGDRIRGRRRRGRCSAGFLGIDRRLVWLALAVVLDVRNGPVAERGQSRPRTRGIHLGNRLVVRTDLPDRKADGRRTRT